MAAYDDDRRGGRGGRPDSGGQDRGRGDRPGGPGRPTGAGRGRDGAGSGGGYRGRDDGDRGYRGGAGRSDDRGGYRGAGAGRPDDRGGYRGAGAGRADDRGAGRSEDRGGYRGRDEDRRGGGERGGYRGAGAGRSEDRGGYRGRDEDRRGGGERGGYRGAGAGAGRSEDRGGYRGRDDDRHGGGDRGGYRGAGAGRSEDRGGYRGRDEDRRGGGGGERGGYRGAGAGRSDERGGYRGAGAGRSEDRGGYRGRDEGRRGDGDRGGYRGAGAGRSEDRGGYRGRDDDRRGGGDRGGYRGAGAGRSEDRGGYRGRDDDRRGGGGDRRRDDDRSRPRDERGARDRERDQPSKVWHNGRRYVGGTTTVRNSDRRTTPKPEGTRDAQGLPAEGTPERPIIPEWDADQSGAGAGAAPGLQADGERLQKVIAAAGVASRRVAENLIVEGRVTVNGEVVEELGRRVDPERDEVAVDGVPVQTDTKMRYVLLNKPVGVVSSMLDDRGRPDLSEWADRYEERLYNVGRLDSETSGLLVLTNDGSMAHVLAHPSFGVTKTYIAHVRGNVNPATVQRLLDGVDLEDGPIAADKVRLLESAKDASLVEITLHSGRNRIVRRMLDEVGHPVLELVRRSFGPLHLGSLPPGRTRELTTVELGKLLAIARGATSPDGPGAAESED